MSRESRGRWAEGRAFPINNWSGKHGEINICRLRYKGISAGFSNIFVGRDSMFARNIIRLYIHT